MIEHNFSYNSFIGGWYIPEKICDDISNYFYEQKNKGLTRSGTIGKGNNTSLYSDIKVSEELMISSKNFDYPFNEYRKYLQDCLERYGKRYDKLGLIERFNVNTPYNLQFYKKDEGFKVYHCERTGGDYSLRRCLVFMTYLNNVDDGGTDFYYQKITSPAKKGLTLIWPTDWTHMHKSQISETKEKMILTGWFTFDD